MCNIQQNVAFKYFNLNDGLYWPRGPPISCTYKLSAGWNAARNENPNSKDKTFMNK